MNQYETVFILTPVLSAPQMKEAVDQYRAFLTGGGAEILYEENWGMRKLAYTIQKKSSGFYILFGFKAEPTLIKRLEVTYRRDERVLRYLTVRMEKYAIAYAARRAAARQGVGASPAGSGDGEPQSPAEPESQAVAPESQAVASEPVVESPKEQ